MHPMFVYLFCRQMQSNIGAAQARVQIRSNPPPYPVPPPPYPGAVSNIQVSEISSFRKTIEWRIQKVYEKTLQAIVEQQKTQTNSCEQFPTVLPAESIVIVRNFAFFFV